MKWYAKQLKELRKKEDAVAEAASPTEKKYPGQGIASAKKNLSTFKTTGSNKAVVIRNQSRPKTDSK